MKRIVVSTVACLLVISSYFGAQALKSRRNSLYEMNKHSRLYAQNQKKSKTIAWSKSKNKKSEKKVLKKKQKALKKRVKIEHQKRRKLEKEAATQQKKEKKRLSKSQWVSRLDKAEDEIDRKDREKMAKVKADRKHRKTLMERWKGVHAQEVKEDWQAGRYADLYKSPAWPIHATRVPKKHMLNVGFSFDCASDAYSSTGMNHDITKLAFGEDDVYVKDLLLVSKLLAAGTGGLDTPTTEAYLKAEDGLANKKVVFLGETKSYGVNFDLTRYIWRHNIAVGIHMPIVYKENKLKAFVGDLSYVDVFDIGGGGNKYPLVYGADSERFLKDVFKAKGMSELGGSSTGLGDIEFFAHVNFKSPRFDNMIAGMRFIVPTAQEASTGKVWAPELGNGGSFDGSFFAGVTMYKNWYVNPHVFVEVGGSLPNTVDRRVPKKIGKTFTGGVDGTTFSGNKKLSEFLAGTEDKIAFSDRVIIPEASSSDPGKTLTLDMFDTTFKNLADNTASFKINKGPQLLLRVGNMFERFIFRRAFLDIYWQWRMKWEDEVSGLPRDVWNIDIYEKNTEVVEHKVGLQWSYQFDEATRLKAGAEYVFAGRNTPKMFSLNVMLNHSF